MQYPITKADHLSKWLVAQQVIGAATFISNTVKVIGDIVKITLICCKNSSGSDLKQYQIRRHQLVEDLQRHAIYMGYGVLRFIPVVGTVFSSCRISNFKVVEIDEECEKESEEIAIGKVNVVRTSDNAEVEAIIKQQVINDDKIVFRIYINNEQAGGADVTVGRTNENGDWTDVRKCYGYRTEGDKFEIDGVGLKRVYINMIDTRFKKSLYKGRCSLPAFGAR